MHSTHIPDLSWIEQRSRTGKFHSFCRNVSVALGSPRNTGTWGGGHPFDVQIRRIPAGASVCPFHAHLAQWELFLVQSGAATVRAGNETHPAGPGDVFIHPPGEPHQLSNAGDADLEVLIVADNPQLDAFHYPDSSKWGLRPPGTYFRINEVDYFDGEEPPAGEPAAFKPAPAPAMPPLTPFSERKRHSDSIPWETWQSPKGTFRGTSRELSIALGAKRNTPTGLGGHPFDLEFNKVAPGEIPNPFHSHAAQWESYLIVSGRATVRANAETKEFGAGAAIIHPPGEAHQIRNASTTEDLVFLLIADNPPVDYWYYPDSKKWGLRDPRMFFRPKTVEYYDGEE